MATHALIMPAPTPRRAIDAAGEALRRGLGFASLVTPELRAAIEHEAHSLLDAATFLIDFLNAADRSGIDLEPDAEGEADPIEASSQPVTLAPDWVRPVQVITPTRRQIRAAYRAQGLAVPANLQTSLGSLFV